MPKNGFSINFFVFFDSVTNFRLLTTFSLCNEMGDVLKLFCPEEYQLDFLKKGTRSDGRTFDDFRSTVVQARVVSTANGSAMVRQGNTLVIASVQAELGVPRTDSPDQGRIELRVQLSPTKSDFCDEILVSQADSSFCADTIQGLLNNGNLIDPKDLCVELGKICWVLWCDVLVLDGKAFLDDMLVALSAAFQCTTLPMVSLTTPTNNDPISMTEMNGLSDGSGVERENLFTSDRIKVDFGSRRELKLSPMKPAATSFLFLRFGADEGKKSTESGETCVLTDPTYEEMRSLSSNTGTYGLATIIVGENRTLCGVYLSGDAGISSEGDSLDGCLKLAYSRRKVVTRLISEACAK